MQAQGRQSNPFFQLKKVLQPEALKLAVQTQRSLSPNDNSGIEEIFERNDIYKERTLANGTSYDSFCFHGPLGTYPFEAVIKRIITKEDEFDKALVLTTNYDDAKRLGQRLCHHANNVCRDKYPDAHKILGRTRTDTSVSSEKNDIYKPRGVDANDKQILFYDVSALKTTLGKDLKGKSSVEAKKLIAQRVSELIEKQNLTSTKQLYINHAEEFTTDISADILQELIAQLKFKNGGGEFKVGAIANYDYVRGEGASLEKFFGRPVYLKTPKQYRPNHIPQYSADTAESLRDKETVTQAHLSNVTKSPGFNKALATRIEQGVKNGDKRIFVRAHSNEAMQALSKTLSDLKIKHGFVREYKGSMVDENGNLIQEKVPSSQLLSRWGNDFEVLVHAENLDKLQEPADLVITATKIMGADKLEELATPLFTIRHDGQDTNKLIYYKFGKDLNRDQDIKQLLKQVESRHARKGRGVRELKSSSGTRGDRAEIEEFDNYDAEMETQWTSFSEPYRAFWTHALGGKKNIVVNLKKYLEDRDSDNRLSDKNLFNNELYHCWRLINSMSLNAVSTLKHDRREVIEYLLKQNNKKVEDFVARYPSITDIKTMSEAQARVEYIYQDLYNKVDNSNSETVQKIDKLAQVQLGFDAKREHRSAIIAKFLFTTGLVDTLKTQRTSLKNGNTFDDSSLKSAILALMDVEKVPVEIMDPDLKEAFNEFLDLEISALSRLKEANTLGVSRELALEVSENYLLEEEAKFTNEVSYEEFVERQTYLAEALMKLEGIGADTNKFYRYVAEQSGTPTLVQIIKAKPELLDLEGFHEVAYITEALLAKESDASSWSKKFLSLDEANNLVATYVDEYHKDLLSLDRKDELSNLIDLLSGTKTKDLSVEEQDEFRKFVKLVARYQAAEISKLHGSKKALGEEELLSKVIRSNPELTGLRDREELVPALQKILKSELKRFYSKFDSKTSISSLELKPYYDLVNRFAFNFSYEKLAQSLGLKVDELTDIYFPEELKKQYQKSFDKILVDLKTAGKETDLIKEMWANAWGEKLVRYSIAKNTMAFDLLARPNDENFLTQTFIADSRTVDGVSQASRGFFFLSSEDVFFAKYLDPNLNNGFIAPTRSQQLAYDWSVTGSLGDNPSTVIYDKADVWRKFLINHTDRVVDYAMDDIQTQKQAILERRKSQTIDLSQLGRNTNTTQNYDENLILELNEASVRNYAKALEGIFDSNLASVTKDSFIELFQDFIQSDYYKDNHLASKFQFAGLNETSDNEVADLGLLFTSLFSGGANMHLLLGDSFAVEAVQQKLLSEFINYLGDRFNSPKLQAAILRDISDQLIVYDKLDYDLKALRSQASKEGFSADTIAALGLLKSVLSIKAPSLPGLKKQIQSALSEEFANLEQDDRDRLLAYVENASNWQIFMDEIFAVNLLDLDIKPEMRLFQDQDNVYRVQLEDAKSASSSFTITKTNYEELKSIDTPETVKV